jgi:tRNA-2-methylthio-N6-dimethylallyladenosine synthase
MQDHRDKIMDYIHLPVQSGSSEVLERMNRGYSREEYIRKVNMILEIMPGAALSTDIIVGFPGESEPQFEETMSLLEEVPYESIFFIQILAEAFYQGSSLGGSCFRAREVETVDGSAKPPQRDRL